PEMLAARLAQADEDHAEAEARLDRGREPVEQGLEVEIGVDLIHHPQDLVQLRGAAPVLVELAEVELAETFPGLLQMLDPGLQRRGLTRPGRVGRSLPGGLRRPARGLLAQRLDLAAGALELGLEAGLGRGGHVLPALSHAALRSPSTVWANASTTSGSN